MGDKITMGDSLTITIFSMIIVFLALLIISFLIDILRTVSNKNEKKDDNQKLNIVTEKEKEKEEQGIAENEELVAVIAAAIAASEGVSIPQVKIKTIKRMPQHTPVWAKTGREEQILNILQ